MRVFRKALRDAALSIPFENLAAFTYQNTIEFGVSFESIRDAYYSFYDVIGKMHGRRVGRDINRQLKNVDLGFFDRQYATMLSQWLLTNGGDRIVTVRRSLIKYLIEFMQLKLDEGLTMEQVSTEIRKHILSRGFYRWQIERIVRTETTAAANLGAVTSGNISGVLMQKEWISANDSRTRRHELGDSYDHLDMDGVLVGPNDSFVLDNRKGGFESLLFPGDPKGSAGNVINCRCTVAMIPKRDENGDLVFT